MKSYFFTLIVSLYFTLIFNLSFFRRVIEIIKKQEPTLSIFLVLSIPIALFTLLYLFFLLFSFRYIQKGFVILLILISSALAYASLTYGIIFNKEVLLSVFDTNRAESMSYINFSSMTWFVFTGILPSIWVYKVRIIRAKFWRESIRVGQQLLVCVLVIFTISKFYYVDYASIGRNNQDTYKLIIPARFVQNAVKIMRDELIYKNQGYKQLGLDASTTKSVNDKNNLLIMVVGETARSKSIAYNGYDRPTNIYTSSKNVISFPDADSCATITVQSVPCMFSRMNKSNYNYHTVKHQDNVLDIMQRVGIGVTWMDNNAGCQGVCKNIKTIEYDTNKANKLCDGQFCFDEVLIEDLNHQLRQLKGRDAVVVLHLIGSHGPTYFRRYPEKMAYFKPTCDKSAIQNCSQEALINTYDNTILYTDYILSRVIETLESQNDDWNTAMLYASDHGESLGENGIYLHGIPISVAPKEQKTVPFILWLSPSYIKDNKVDYSCIKDYSMPNYSHDNLFDTLLGIMKVKTAIYDYGQDIVSNCIKDS